MHSTVRNLWIKENIGARYKRLERLEEEKNSQEVELTEKHIKLLKKTNPCFREKRAESSYPGYLLCPEIFMVHTFKGISGIYLQAMLDTYGSFAFGKLHTWTLPETAVDILCDRVMISMKRMALRWNIY